MLLIKLRSWTSSSISQGPFFNFGFRKQFQCSLHCLALLKTLSSALFEVYSYYAMSLQLRLVKRDIWCPIYCLISIMFFSKLLSWRDQENDERLTFFRLNHLNRQFLAQTPGINWEMRSQSSKVKSFSKFDIECNSEYFERIHTSILISSSLQFFFILLFFAIFSILHVTIRTTV